MTHRDITGTNPQGVPSGPRPDQTPHASSAPEQEDALGRPIAAELREQDEDADRDPVADIDELGAAVDGDSDRPVDATEGKHRVT